MSKTSDMPESAPKRLGAPPVRPPALPPEVLAEIAPSSDAEREELLRAWDVAGRLLDDPAHGPDFSRAGDQIWQNLEAAIGRETRRSPLRLVRVNTYRAVAIAASIALLVAIGTIFYLQPITVTAPYGQTASIDLPDGSHVELNSGSTLTYPRFFSSKGRNVYLEGEAFFDVASSKVPFNATTFNAVVTVLGTEFNVRSWKNEPSAFTEVVLASGSVRLASLSDRSNAVTLEPGQSSRVIAEASAPAMPAAVGVSDALAWRSGRFVATNQSVTSVLDELERRYDISINHRSAQILEGSLSLSYEKKDGAETILNDICVLKNCTVKPVDGGFELHPLP
jgi:transmembrane sensor